MDITVTKYDADIELFATAFTGGESATCEVKICINTNLPMSTQRNLVIHAVLENYLQGYPHRTYEELSELLCDALDQLEALPA